MTRPFGNQNSGSTKRSIELLRPVDIQVRNGQQNQSCEEQKDFSEGEPEFPGGAAHRNG